MTWLSRLLPSNKSLRHVPSDFNRRAKQRRRRFTLEGLEDRVVLSNVGVFFDAPTGVLTITPDRFNNQFKITELSAASGGQVRVEALPLSPMTPGVFATTIGGSSAPFTTWAAVTTINVNFVGGNDTDRVELTGGGTVKNVNFNLTTTTLQTLDINNVNNAGAFKLTTASGLPDVNVNGSKFQSVSIVQSGVRPSNVEFNDTTVSGAVNVALGNGPSTILVDDSTFGATTLSQGDGAGAEVRVTDSKVQTLAVKQGNGNGDKVIVTNVQLSQVGIGLSVEQGNGNGNQAIITSVSTPTLAPPPASVPISMIPSIVVKQGNGNLDRAHVIDSHVWGDIKITQGNGYQNDALIQNSSAGYVVAAGPLQFPVLGTASIVQGNGSGDVAKVLNTAAPTGRTFNSVYIKQGTANNFPSPYFWTGPNSALASNLEVFGNITLIQDNAANSEAGASARVLNSLALQGGIAIEQKDGGQMSALVSESDAHDDISITQGNGSGDSAVVEHSGAGDDISITQGNGSGNTAAVEYSGAGDDVSITQGNGSGVSASIYFSEADDDMSIVQGDGAGDSASIFASEAGGDISIAQGDGAGDSAVIFDSQSDRNVSITQGDGDGATAMLYNTTATGILVFGPEYPYVFSFFGNATITQGTGAYNTASVYGGALNNLEITQGDSEYAGGQVIVDAVAITDSLAITQGGASSEGGYLTFLAPSGDVTVGGSTSITQSGANNTVLLGDVFGGTTSFITYFLDIFTGDNGGGFVAAQNAIVFAGPLFGLYTVDGGNGGNSFFDGGGNFGITVSDNFDLS